MLVEISTKEFSLSVWNGFGTEKHFWHKCLCLYFLNSLIQCQTTALNCRLELGEHIGWHILFTSFTMCSLALTHIHSLFTLFFVLVQAFLELVFMGCLVRLHN